MTRRGHMRLGSLVVAVAFAGLATLHARQAQPARVAVDPDDLGGVVEGPRGPEAGVWVIAETDSLPTKFRKIVVTDDAGRFLLPDLPRATYRVLVRGYGLVDSTPITASPGNIIRLTAVPAPTPQAAARIFPPSYWFSLLEAPPPSMFPGTGVEKGNGIPEHIKSQAEWLAGAKVGCNNCHQMGDVVTRTNAHIQSNYKSSIAAWEARLRFGQRDMKQRFESFAGWDHGLKVFASWTDRIAAGEVPPTPPRPSGVERNLVLTMWDWGTTTSYTHDLITTDKRKPTLNANGLVYGLDFGRDYLLVLDPAEGKATEIKVPTRDKPVSRFPLKVVETSPFWGNDVLWDAPAAPHNPMMDSKGRIWITQRIREPENVPAFCKDGARHPSAKFYPVKENGSQLSYFDPKTQKFTFVDTCFGTQHLQFAEDADETLFLSSPGSPVRGWIKTRVFDETGDLSKSLGWCPQVVDTNGDGKAGPFVHEAAPFVDQGTHSFKGNVPRNVPAGMDLVVSGGYGIIVNPVDGTVWGANPGPFPGRLIRLDPKTCLAEIYEPPMHNPAAPGKHGATPRGVDVDRNGLIWTALAGTGHTASFDRRKCKVLNGPTATGQHCPEGWTLYPSPGPKFKGVTEPGSADYHYYNWVDQFNTLGLGANVPITNGTTSDSLIAVMPQTGQSIVFRVPYPVGFFTRGLDGRIDDPNAGWKGRGLWANNATNVVWHIEGGKGTKGTAVHFQLRPDPLAK